LTRWRRRLAAATSTSRVTLRAFEWNAGLSMDAKSNRIIVTVIGKDTVGIIAAVATVLAEAHVNIVDISQTTLREFFTMIMMADMDKATVPFDELKRRLDAKGEQMGLKIDAQHEDVFKFMHRI
jgi:ACT domain-containing protein